MPKSNLKPLNEVDDSIIDHGQTEIKPKRCKHELELVSSTEARCKKCPVGYTGPNIIKLVNSQ